MTNNEGMSSPVRSTICLPSGVEAASAPAVRSGTAPAHPRACRPKSRARPVPATLRVMSPSLFGETRAPFFRTSRDARGSRAFTAAWKPGPAGFPNLYNEHIARFVYKVGPFPRGGFLKGALFSDYAVSRPPADPNTAIRFFRSMRVRTRGDDSYARQVHERFKTRRKVRRKAANRPSRGRNRGMPRLPFRRPGFPPPGPEENPSTAGTFAFTARERLRLPRNVLSSGTGGFASTASSPVVIRDSG